jgi:hypothetical protein
VVILMQQVPQKPLLALLLLWFLLLLRLLALLHHLLLPVVRLLLWQLPLLQLPQQANNTPSPALAMVPLCCQPCSGLPRRGARGPILQGKADLSLRPRAAPMRPRPPAS